MNVADELLRMGLVTQTDLDQAARAQKSDGLRVDQALIKLGLVGERELLEILGRELSVPLANLDGLMVDPDVIALVPSRLVFRKQLVPISRENGTLHIATSDPFDLYALDEVRLLTGLDIEPILAPSTEIDKLIKAHYGLGGNTVDEMVDSDDPTSISLEEGTEDLLEMAQEASVIKLVNEIIIEALNERASDIHVEPFEHTLSIRYRIDGVLQEAAVPPQIHRFRAAIISRIKILANMNIAEKRLPQDGRIKLRVGRREIDMRTSVIPMLFGEGVVMRILDKSSVLYPLTELGMDETTFDRFEDLIARPHGIVLVTGPTGSGKTTTLYAALNAIVGPDKKVLTVEDPVEYNLDGINQIPVAHQIGLTFERGLRAILRHDPDIVMIGEIRDLETAVAATQASLTGHLVLSTLHTNDAASAATRLVDMGVEPFLVSSTLTGTMAQRLVRTVCSNCKIEYTPVAEDLPRDYPNDPGLPLFKGEGCPECRKTGYRGRCGVYELMPMSAEIAARIMERTPSSELVRVAREQGMTSLREDGWDKVARGLTTPDEVVRCTAI